MADETGAARETLEELEEQLEEVDFKPVSMGDLRIVRDKDGEIIPIDVVTPMEGTPIRIVPMTLGDRLRYKLKVTDDMKIEDLTPAMKHNLIRNHVVEPDFSKVKDKEFREEFGYTTVEDLAAAVMMYSRDIFRRPLVIKQQERRVGKAKARKTKKE